MYKLLTLVFAILTLTASCACQELVTTGWLDVKKIHEDDTSNVLSIMSIQDFAGSKVILSDLFYGQLYFLDVETAKIVQTLAPDVDLIDSVSAAKNVVLFSDDFDVLDLEEASDHEFFQIAAGSVPPIRRPMFRAAAWRSERELDVLTTVFVPCYKSSTDELLWLQCVVVASFDATTLTLESVTILNQSEPPFPSGTGFSVSGDEWFVVVHNMQAVAGERFDQIDVIQRYSLTGQKIGNTVKLNEGSRSKGYKGGFFFNPTLFNETFFLFCSQREGELHVAPKSGGYTKIIDLRLMISNLGLDPDSVGQYFSPIKAEDGSAQLGFRLTENGEPVSYNLFLTIDDNGEVKLTKWSRAYSEKLVGNAVLKENTGEMIRELISRESGYHIAKEYTR